MTMRDEKGKTWDCATLWTRICIGCMQVRCHILPSQSPLDWYARSRRRLRLRTTLPSHEDAKEVIIHGEDSCLYLSKIAPESPPESLGLVGEHFWVSEQVALVIGLADFDGDSSSHLGGWIVVPLRVMPFCSSQFANASSTSELWPFNYVLHGWKRTCYRSRYVLRV